MIILLTSVTMMVAMLVSAAVVIVNETRTRPGKVERSNFGNHPTKR